MKRKLFVLLMILAVPFVAKADDPIKGVYENTVQGVHIRTDNLSQAEILKYEAAFKQAFDKVLMDDSQDNHIIHTINTKKFTFEGKEMYINGIDTFITEVGGTNLVERSMNIIASTDGCPSSFSYNFDLTTINTIDWTYNLSVKSVDGSFDQTFTISGLDLRFVGFTPASTQTQENNTQTQNNQTENNNQTTNTTETIETPVSQPEEPKKVVSKNPKTGDSIYIYIATIIASMIGIKLLSKINIKSV